MTTSKRVTIFEGCDGSGKSTAAQAYATLTGARYVHSGPFPGVGDAQLGRLYVEAMLPALLGYQDVVLDRCWISEAVYGTVYRGHDRLQIGTRLLDRLAWRCGAVLVHCHPDYATVKANWSSRRAAEMLEEEQQLKRVYAGYAAGVDLVPLGHLNTVYYDYTKEAGGVEHLAEAVARIRPPCHALSDATAGNLRARVLLVGEKFTDVTNSDGRYQWPFGSFSGAGSSRWLASRLEEANVGEDQLLWANADMDLRRVIGQWDETRVLESKHHRRPGVVVALGDEASHTLHGLGVRDYLRVTHPQFHKRFHAKEPYALIDLLKETLK